MDNQETKTLNNSELMAIYSSQSSGDPDQSSSYLCYSDYDD